jgi:hypothetical protein
MDDEENAPVGANGKRLPSAPYELGSGIGAIAEASATDDQLYRTDSSFAMRKVALDFALTDIPAGEWEDTEIVARAETFLTFLRGARQP